MIPESVRELIGAGPLAHLTTLNPDGSPQVSVVWVGIENDEIVIASMGEAQKVKNVRREPQVALSMLGPETNQMGLREYLVVYGAGRVTEGGAAALLQQLARIYIAPDAEFPPEAVRRRPGFITRIRPERYVGIGPWATGQ
jgi:PPOX class probable F420-dependent enzyme